MFLTFNFNLSNTLSFMRVLLVAIPKFKFIFVARIGLMSGMSIQVIMMYSLFVEIPLTVIEWACSTVLRESCYVN